VSDEDPFEEFEVEDREGDPFERLDADATGDDETTADEGTDDTDAPEPAADDPAEGAVEPVADADPTGETPTGTTPDTVPEAGGRTPGPDDRAPDAEDPFADVAGREGDPFDAPGSVFEEMDVEGVDPDTVWEQLSDAESRGSVVEREDNVYAEVSKHSYCEGCEWFSEPPAATCTHEDAQIIEFLDMETVRLLNCPVVAERRALEEEG
jgi:hypothetical protein